MTKGVQLWPGDSMRAFYRRHIARETALDAASTERLVEALTKATNRMLVWQMPGEDGAVTPAPAPQTAGKTADKKPAAEKSKPAKGVTQQPRSNRPNRNRRPSLHQHRPNKTSRSTLTLFRPWSCSPSRARTHSPSASQR